MNITILRNKLTGLFFNGTNFSVESAASAKRIEGPVNENAIRSVWGDNTQVIEVTPEQMAKLEESDELMLRSRERSEQARQLDSAKRAAALRAAATRLRQRSISLAVEVYATFPRFGHNV